MCLLATLASGFLNPCIAQQPANNSSSADNVQAEADDGEENNGATTPPEFNGQQDRQSDLELLETSIRRIYFYESQAPKLVPPSFWPVSIEELETALSRREDSPASVEDRPYLASAVYVARYQRGALVSDASTFDIIYRDRQPTSLELGKMNLALESQSAIALGSSNNASESSNRAGRLVTDGTGTVRAMVDQDCRLRFGWSRRGVAVPGGSFAFDLQIPACGRTRIVLGMPDGVVLKSRDGVLTALPSPPPEARNTQGETALSWYAIEAGGLSRVRLTVQDRAESRVVEQKYTKRKLGLDCAIDRRGLNWTALMVVDVPRGSALPKLIVSDGGRFTEIRVNGQPVRWQETTLESGTELTFATDSNESFAAVEANKAASDLATSIELSGTVSMAGKGNDELKLAIPWLRLAQTRTTLAVSESEILLRLGPGVRLAELLDAGNWSSEQTGGDSGLNAIASETAAQKYKVSGPPNERPPVVRCLITRVLGLSVAAFRLAVVDDGLKANWEAAIESRDEGPQPLTFQVQTGWQVESVSIRASGRVVDLRDEESGKFTLWPEPGDIVDGVLRIQITGSRGLTETDDKKSIPGSWFIRQTDAMLQSYAAVVPPADYEWVAGTALVGGMIDRSDLPELASEMIGPIIGETLLFASHNGETPPLELAQPPAAFNSDVQFDLRIEGKDLVERLRIDFRVPAGRVPGVQVHLGLTKNRPPMRWIVLEKLPAGMRFPVGTLEANSSGESLNAQPLIDPSSAATEDGAKDDAEDQQEVWQLEPSGGIRDGLTLYGERRYPLDLQETTGPKTVIGRDSVNDSDTISEGTDPQPPIEWMLPLPSLPISPAPQGSTHRATVSLGSHIDLLDTGGEVLRIPRIATDKDNIAWMLRYDPSEDANIMISPHPERDPVPVIWEQKIDLLTGTAGDEIAADFKVEGGDRLVIDFDPSMIVTRVEGVQYELEQSKPGTLTIETGPDNRQFQIFFWRPSTAPRLVRKAEPPNIRAHGIVMRYSVNLWPATDTIAMVLGELADAPQWMAQEARGTKVSFSDANAIWLIPSALAWAIGSGIAMLCFAAGWILMSRLAWLTAAAVLVSTICGYLLPVWDTSIFGFIVIPLAAAGLFTSSLAVQRLRAASYDGDNGVREPALGSNFVDPLAPTATHKQHFNEVARTDSALQSGDGEPLEADKDTSGSDKSNSSSHKPWVGFFLLFFVAAAVQLSDFANAKMWEDDPSNAKVDPAPVMIPVDKDGQIVGERVYVPKNLFDLLFRPKTIEEQLGRIDFQSADYDVRVSSSGMRGVSDTVSVEAVWRVEIDSASQLVRLPIDPSTLEKLEVIVDSVPNEIRPEADGSSILVRPPKAGVNIIRASLIPQVETTVAGTGRISLPIPAVANASITITPDTPLEQISLPLCLGQINRFDSGTRLTASLGPVENLEVIWQRRGSLAKNTTSSLRRRWWVYAGKDSLSRELELDVGSDVRSGVIVELTADGLASPQVTTSDWTFAPNEASDATRNRLRLISTIDSPGPIRLMWMDSASNLSEAVVSLPDIRPTTQSGGIATSVAVDMPDGWRLNTIESSPTVDSRPSVSSAISTPTISTPASTESDTESAVTASATDALITNGDGQGELLFKAIEANEFATAWRGYRGEIDFAREHPSPGAILIRLTGPLTGHWTAEISHNVTVTSGHLEVDFVASITPAPNSTTPLSILLPRNFRVARFEINGRLLERLSESTTFSVDIKDNIPSAIVTEVLLPTLQPNLMSEVRVTGTIELPDDRRFSIPRVRIQGAKILDEWYVMSRTDGLRVRELREPQAAVPAAFPAEYDLMAGTVPLRSWQITESQSESAETGGKKKWDGGRFRVNVVNDLFAANSLTTLRWNDGVWTMEYVVQVENFAGLTDFLTFRIPSRWIEGLDVQPAVKWSSQPATDSDSHLIRVLPTTSTVDRMVTSSDSGDATTRKLLLRMTSRLENAGDGGVSVPQVLLLGGGRRTNCFAVPKKLTTSPIIWQVQNARPENIPPPFISYSPTDETHAIYEAIGETFSATLQPAPVGTNSAEIPLVDLAFFPGEDASRSVTGLMRVFVLPGDREYLEFSIPPDTRVMGAWAAGTSVGFQSREGNNSGDKTTPGSVGSKSASVVRVPLALSRLADQVVLLFEVNPPSDQQSMKIPSVVDLPVAMTWVSKFEQPQATPQKETKLGFYQSLRRRSEDWLSLRALPPSQAPSGEELSPTAARYRHELVQTITELLSGSIDSAAERPSAEKREWLKPWFVRLNSWGWNPSPADLNAEPVPESTERTTSSDRQLPDASRILLDEWSPKFFQRIFGNDLSNQGLEQTQIEGSWMTTPAGWTATELRRFANFEGKPLTEVPYQTFPVQQEFSKPMQWLRSDNLIALALLVAGAGLLFVFGKRLLYKPAFWLFLLGCASLGLAPLPISIAAILLGLAAPIFRKP